MVMHSSYSACNEPLDARVPGYGQLPDNCTPVVVVVVVVIVVVVVVVIVVVVVAPEYGSTRQLKAPRQLSTN